MQWGHFVCPSCSQKRETTEFELIAMGACTWVRIPPEATLIFIFPLPQVSFFLSFFLSTSPITSCMYYNSIVFTVKNTCVRSAVYLTNVCSMCFGTNLDVGRVLS